MRYIASLLLLVSIGFSGLQFSMVSATTQSGVVSGERRNQEASPRVQLLQLKRTLTEIRKKIKNLELQIAYLKKRIETGLSTNSMQQRLEDLMKQYTYAKNKEKEIQKKIEATASGVIQKL